MSRINDALCVCAKKKKVSAVKLAFLILQKAAMYVPRVGEGKNPKHDVGSVGTIDIGARVPLIVS